MHLGVWAAGLAFLAASAHLAVQLLRAHAEHCSAGQKASGGAGAGGGEGAGGEGGGGGGRGEWGGHGRFLESSLGEGGWKAHAD